MFFTKCYVFPRKMHRSRLKFGENQVNGRVSGLHCTWLVSRTRVSSDEVDGFLTLRVDPLKEARSTLRAWPKCAVVCNRALVLCLAGIDYEMLELGSDGLVLGIQTLTVEPQCCITCSFKFRCRSYADVS
ncbi:hypothetical protein M9H77_16749 [Catharanthus roseus]|uniref:Uncharacterized protein n=1 Tax=Catharanthus roseus TaxID=4058 RepID=A0ACC0B2N3_CATRO|nr:hypothetical protein M9H77_16749 [Catharanthus roseus]